MPISLPDSGLCAACLHARIVVSGRGSRFILCELSRTDPRFRRYPPLPVVDCLGYEPNGRLELDRGPLDAPEGAP